MRYFIKYLKDGNIQYVVSNIKPSDWQLKEVEPEIFKRELESIGIPYELPEDKVKKLQLENGDLIKDIALKDITIDSLQSDIGDIIKTIALI